MLPDCSRRRRVGLSTGLATPMGDCPQLCFDNAPDLLTRLPSYLSVRLSLCLPAYLSVCVCPSIYSTIRLSLCLACLET